ncbi:hypothetical protein HK096_010082, partial [Nowakowskiella sp. JEL0078]
MSKLFKESCLTPISFPCCSLELLNNVISRRPFALCDNLQKTVINNPLNLKSVDRQCNFEYPTTSSTQFRPPTSFLSLSATSNNKLALTFSACVHSSQCSHTDTSSSPILYWFLQDTTPFKVLHSHFSGFSVSSNPRDIITLAITPFGIIDCVQFSSCNIFLGYGVQELISVPIMKFVHPDDVGALCRGFSLLSKQHRRVGMALNVRWKREYLSFLTTSEDVEMTKMDDQVMEQVVSDIEDDLLIQCEFDDAMDYEVENDDKTIMSGLNSDSCEFLNTEVLALMVPRHYLGHCDHPRCSVFSDVMYTAKDLVSLFSEIEKDTEEEFLGCIVRVVDALTKPSNSIFVENIEIDC